jgi:hypothetical protein
MFKLTCIVFYLFLENSTHTYAKKFHVFQVEIDPKDEDTEVTTKNSQFK